MKEILSMLLQAIKVSQVHHWKCKSFAKHIALGELYDALVKHTDALAEIYMGKYGDDIPINTGAWSFPEADAVEFVKSLSVMIENMKGMVTDDYILNRYEELQADVSRAKYKIENLA